MTIDKAGRSVAMNRALWIVQVLLALVFLLAGVMKFVMSVEQMNAGAPVQLSGWLLRFIGACEILGAIGLVLPGLLGIKPGLTPLAAAGLIIIMIGATIIPLVGGAIAQALVPLAFALLLTFVAHGRRSTILQANQG